MPKWLASALHIGGEIIQVAAILTVVPGVIPANIGAIIWAIAKAASVFGLKVALPNVPPGQSLVTVPSTMLTATEAGKSLSATVPAIPDDRSLIVVAGDNPLVASQRSLSPPGA